MNFDENILGAEFLRNFLRSGVANKIPTKKRFCTMETYKEFVGIRNSMGFKWPKLQELHRAVFGSYFEGAHDALFDVRATAKCYWEMKRREDGK
jgi:DNA polymerase III epsilon subunit-like protein